MNADAHRPPYLRIATEEAWAPPEAIALYRDHLASRDLDDIGTNMAVARPRRVHVVGPQMHGDRDRRGHGDRRQAEAAQMDEGFHDRYSEDR